MFSLPQLYQLLVTLNEVVARYYHDRVNRWSAFKKQTSNSNILHCLVD